MPFLSIRKYAKYRGVSDTTVRKMIDANRITANSIDYSNPIRPLIDVDRADIELGRNTNPNLIRQTRTGKTSLSLLKAPTAKKALNAYGEHIASGIDLDDDGNPIQSESGTGPVVDLSKDPTTLYEAREHEAIWKAIKMKLETQKARRELVNIGEVNIVLTDFGVKFRSDILDIPDRISEDLHAAETPFEVRKLLYEALEDALFRNSNLELK